MPPSFVFAGFSTQDITPPLKLQIRLGGFLRIHRYAKKVIHPIMARAIAFRHSTDPKQNLIVMSCDLVGFQYRLAKIVRRVISRHTGVPIAHIMLHFTHSHSTPDAIGIFGNKIRQFPRLDVQYPVVKHMMRNMIRAGIEAFRHANTQINIGYGETAPLEPALAIQRRPPYRHLNTPIRIIKITENLTNRLLAVIVNYQAHPTQLPQENSDISCEYPGLVAQALYERLPGLKFAAYFNGALGDITIHGYKGYFAYIWESVMKQLKIDWPNASKEERRAFIAKVRNFPRKQASHESGMRYAIQQIELLGQKFTDYIIPALNTINTQPLTTLHIRRRFLFPQVFRNKPIKSRIQHYKTIAGKLHLLKLEAVSRLRIFGLIYGFRILNGRYLPALNLRKNGRHLLHQTELQTFKLNDIIWMAVPGEPFEVYSRLLLNKVPNHRGFFTNMANDTCGYIFPYSFYLSGGYETTFSFDLLYGEYLLKAASEELDRLLSTNSA